MRILFFLLLFCIPIFSQEKKETSFKINRFVPINYDSGIYGIRLEASSIGETFPSIVCNQNTILDSSNKSQDCQVKIQYANIELEVLPETIKAENGFMEFYVKSKTFLPLEAKRTLVISLSEELSLKAKFSIPKPNDLLPSIVQIFPRSGAAGEVITIIGKNIDENPENVRIGFEYYFRGLYDLELREFAWTKPIFVSVVNDDGLQTLKFILPFKLEIPDFSANPLKNPIRIKMVSNHREAYYENAENFTFNLLHPRWKLSLMGFSLLSIIIFYIIIGLFKRKLFWSRGVFWDFNTNKYSLAKFEILTWTGIFILGFFYTIYYFLLFERRYTIDWNYSILALFFIVYIPLFFARIMDKSHPKNELITTPPHLSDLVFSKNALDITRFQMFGFSLITKLGVLYLLFYTDLFEAPLVVPYHFTGFLLASRVFYLAGKFLKEDVSIQSIEPMTWGTEEPIKQIELKGIGFEKGQKIQIGNSYPQVLNVTEETTAWVKWKQKLPPGLYQVYIYSESEVLANTVPCIRIVQNIPVEPNPPVPLSVESNSSTKSKSA